MILYISGSTAKGAEIKDKSSRGLQQGVVAVSTTITEPNSNVAIATKVFCGVTVTDFRGDGRGERQQERTLALEKVRQQLTTPPHTRHKIIPIMYVCPYDTPDEGGEEGKEGGRKKVTSE